MLQNRYIPCQLLTNVEKNQQPIWKFDPTRRQRSSVGSGQSGENFVNKVDQRSVLIVQSGFPEHTNPALAQHVDALLAPFQFQAISFYAI
jgi:hypothetical protein